jgi:hypothetical protein
MTPLAERRARFRALRQCGLAKRLAEDGRLP